MVFQLDDDIWFPNPRLGEPDGLLAIGGDLSLDRLLLAYCNGIFPWSDYRREQRMWHCPMQRFVIFPEEIHISHSMRTLINRRKYRVTIDRDFEGVIKHCGKLRIDQPGAWLGKEMTEAYTMMHHEGWASSVEVWDNDDKLVGGLYGVTIGRCFVGESMFSLVPNASKLALIFLAQTLQLSPGTLIDCQLKTDHLESMGGRYIPYDEYMKYMPSYNDDE